MKLKLALAAAALVATSAVARADEPTAVGLWEAVDSDNKPEGWFLFTQKNEVYSARLVKGFKKEGDDTPVKVVCTECPGKKKGAHIMGLTLFYGMKRDGLNYENGSVLDPRDGSIYHAKMWLDEDGKTLHVRGYLGISMFGKTQDWHRLPDDAMKKEDIPREILAGDEAKAEKKPKPDAAEKKPHPEDVDRKASGDAPADKPEKADVKPHDAPAADGEKPEKHEKPKKKAKKPKVEKPADPADADAPSPAAGDQDKAQ